MSAFTVRHALRALTVCPLAVLAAVLAPAGASADTVQSYACTGAIQSSTVPAGATMATVTLSGAQGGVNAEEAYNQSHFGDGPSTGGPGDALTVQMSVSAGESLGVNVGCSNGYNGGGAGGGDEYYGYFVGGNTGGGAGGGATDIAPSGGTFAQAYAVAGGGGGPGDAGTLAFSPGTGGNGGASIPAVDGGNGNSNDSSASGGQGGKGAADGAAEGPGGTGTNGNGDSGTAGSGSSSGVDAPAGGSGASSDDIGGNSGGGGGGGGGWASGGGGGAGGLGTPQYSNNYPDGAAGGGGGGGESYVANGVTQVSEAATNDGNGSVTIDYNTPTLSVSPGSNDYGNVGVGLSSSQTFTVSNSGGSTLSLGTVGLTGANADQFTISDDQCSNQSLTGSDTCTVQVAFSPNALDSSDTAQLSIPSNSDSGSPTTVALSGAGVTPPAASVESSQDFGTVTVGQSQYETITVTNNGEADLNIGQASIGGPNAGDFYSLPSQDDCSNQSVSSSGTCTIGVWFAPSSDTAEWATLTIPSNDPNSPASVTLTGQGANPPTASVEPSQDFGTVATGQSQSKTITVSNTGDETMNVGQAAIGGTDPDQFAIGADTCSNQSVVAQGTCTIVVSFTAGSVSADQAVLTIPSNDPNSPASVSLTGQGANPAGTSVEPSQEFGTVTVGESQSETITVTNTGGVSLNVGQAAIAGQKAQEFTLGDDACSNQTVASNGTCTITVRFAPSGAGQASASLTVPSNAAGGPLTVALSGTGQNPAPSATPTQTSPTLSVPNVPTGGLIVHERGPSDVVDVQLSEPGTITVTVEKKVGDRWVPVGSETITAELAGTVHVSVGWRIDGRKLARGHYRVVFVAGAAGRSSTPVSVPLTVRPPANGRHGRLRMLSVAISPHSIVWRRAHRAPSLWLTFLLSRAATLHMSLQARVDGHWQQVAAATTRALAGADRVQLVGRWHGALIPARLVRLTVTARAAGRQSVTRAFYVRVRDIGWRTGILRAFLSTP